MSRLELPQLFDLCQQWTKGAVIQFKKLFLSLIFTVALCCGLSVSAFAMDYYYGSVLAPALPDVDENIYPYCAIYDVSPIDDIRLVYSTVPFAVAKKSGMSYEGLTIPQVADVIWYTLVDGVWEYSISVTDDVAYGLYVILNDIKGLWVNHDVYNSSTNVVFPFQKPTLANRTVEISDSLLPNQLTSSFDYSATSNYYLSYGANTTTNLLPVLTESDVSVSCRVTDGKFDKVTYSLWFLDSSGIDKVSSGSPLVSVSDYVSTGRLPLGTIVEIPDGTKAVWLELYQSGYSFPVSDLESLYFGYSSVVSSYSPALSVTASNITSTTANVTFDATGLDPSKEYQIRMEAVEDSSISGIIATFSGSETFNETVHTTDLTPDTVYSFKYTLIEDGVDTSAVSTLTYTTLPFVYDPKLSVSVFSVTTNTATCQIDMTGFDPSGSYRLYYDLALSEDVGDTSSSVSKGYSNQIGVVSGVIDYTGYHRFTDLSPNTEYYVAWTVEDMVTGTAVPVVDSVTFTTSDDGSGEGGAGSSDDSSGILLMILNKVTAILDTLNGGQSEGILASINEKLGSLVSTLSNPEEQKLENNFKGSLTEVNNNFFGDEAPGQAVGVSDVGNLANAQGTVKTLFQSNYTVSDFFGLFSDNSFFGWFSAETALDLNPSYGSPAVVDLDDPYNMDIYYENLERVRGKK